MILALIQARMASTRLPGKSMSLIEDVPLIEHVIRRVQAAKLVTDICVCVSDNTADDPLVAHVESLGVDVYRGSEDDVLARLYWAAERYPGANPIVRITADDPFKDPELIDYTLMGFLAEWSDPDEEIGACHYMMLGGVTWPTGLGVEVFSRGALETAHKGAVMAEEREHVTPFMGRAFHTWVLKNPHEHGNINMRWTIDTPEELEFAREVYAKLYAADPVFGYSAMRESGY